MEPPFAGKFRSIRMKNQKEKDILLLSEPIPFKSNRLTLLASVSSLQFTKVSECQPFLNYRASNSRLFPYVYCKFCRVCPQPRWRQKLWKGLLLRPIKLFYGNAITYKERIAMSCGQIKFCGKSGIWQAYISVLITCDAHVTTSVSRQH